MHTNVPITFVCETVPVQPLNWILLKSFVCFHFSYDLLFAISDIKLLLYSPWQRRGEQRWLDAAAPLPRYDSSSDGTQK